MAIALIANVRNAQAANGNTSASRDTTGASLLIAHVSSYTAGPAPSISDSYTNTWTPLTAKSTVVDSRSQLFYVKNPIVGTGHTFAVSGTGLFHTTCFAAFSGIDLTSPADGENGGTATSGTTLSTGAITPSANGALIIAGLSSGAGTSGTDAITASLAITDQAAYSAGTAEGGALAWYEQPTAGSINPQWSWTGSTAGCSATIAAFKAAAASGVAYPQLERFGHRGAFRGMLH